jgi:hypothetical protein
MRTPKIFPLFLPPKFSFCVSIAVVFCVLNGCIIYVNLNNKVRITKHSPSWEKFGIASQRSRVMRRSLIADDESQEELVGFESGENKRKAYQQVEHKKRRERELLKLMNLVIFSYFLYQKRIRTVANFFIAPHFTKMLVKSKRLFVCRDWI